jgi:hypothetical protein
MNGGHLIENECSASQSCMLKNKALAIGKESNDEVAAFPLKIPPRRSTLVHRPK